MRNNKKDFSIVERLLVVAILVIVGLVATENVLQSVKASEDRTLNSAVDQYSAVRSMYVEGAAAVPLPIIQATAIDTEDYRATRTR